MTWWIVPSPRFLSTLSLRRATTSKLHKNICVWGFLSTLSLRRATPHIRSTSHGRRGISIHALLAESDTPRLSRVVPTPIFLSTLSLRRATQCRTFANGMYGFLSTLSLRRATPGPKVMTPDKYYFYPRSPCGERQRNHLFSRWIRYFYPRSPCGERPHCFV